LAHSLAGCRRIRGCGEVVRLSGGAYCNGEKCDRRHTRGPRVQRADNLGALVFCRKRPRPFRRRRQKAWLLPAGIFLTHRGAS